MDTGSKTAAKTATKRQADSNEDTAAPKKKRAKKTPTSTVNEISISQNTPSTATFSDLVDDVLIKIIKMVPKAQWASLESVNRQMRHAVHEVWKSENKFRLHEDFVFKREDMTRNRKKLMESFLDKLLLRCPDVKEIGILQQIWPKKPADRQNGFRTLSRFSSLERIDFGCMSTLTSQEVVDFLMTTASSETLKKLYISGSSIDQSVSDALVECHLRNTGNMPSLKLDGLWCGQMWTRGLFALEKMVDFSNLTALHLDEISDCVSPITLLLSRAYRLTSLSVYVHTGYQDEDVRKLFRVIAARNFVALDIGGVTDLFDAHLYSLFQAWPADSRLQKLSLTSGRAPNSVIDFVADNFKRLKVFWMDVGDENQTPALIRLIQNLKELEHLQLFGRYVNGDVIAAIAANLTELRILDVKCSIVPSAVLTSLGQLSNLNHLRISAKFVDNATFIAWSNTFAPNLESFQLILNRRPNMPGLMTFINKCSQLRQLRLEFAGLTDFHLRQIAVSCPLLRDIMVFSDSRQSLDGFRFLIDRCQLLKRLEILNSPALAKSYTEQLQGLKYRRAWVHCGKYLMPFGSEAWDL